MGTTDNNNAQQHVDLRADHIIFPEQAKVTITVADIWGKGGWCIKNWTAPGPDVIYAYWLKKLTALGSANEPAANG